MRRNQNTLATGEWIISAVDGLGDVTVAEQVPLPIRMGMGVT